MWEDVDRAVLGLPVEEPKYGGLTAKDWEELDKSCRRVVARLKPKMEFQAKGEYDQKAFQEVVKDMPLSCLIETNYVTRSWVLSPRGRASVIECKVLFDGYLSKYQPTVSEEGLPEMDITITSTDNTNGT